MKDGRQRTDDGGQRAETKEEGMSEAKQNVTEFDLQDVVTRLVAMIAEGEELRKIIEEGMESGEVIGAGLYGIRHEVEAVIGSIFTHQLRSGRLTFHDKITMQKLIKGRKA